MYFRFPPSEAKLRGNYSNNGKTQRIVAALPSLEFFVLSKGDRNSEEDGDGDAEGD
jgi:hypothetical protein